MKYKRRTRLSNVNVTILVKALLLTVTFTKLYQTGADVASKKIFHT